MATLPELKKERNRALAILAVALAAGYPMMNYFTDVLATEIKGDMNTNVLAMNGLGMAMVLFAWIFIGIKAGGFADDCVYKKRELKKEMRRVGEMGSLEKFVKNNPGTEKMLLPEFKANLKKLDAFNKSLNDMGIAYDECKARCDRLEQYVRNLSAALQM